MGFMAEETGVFTNCSTYQQKLSGARNKKTEDHTARRKQRLSDIFYRNVNRRGSNLGIS